MADGRPPTRGKQQAQEESTTGDDGLLGAAETDISTLKLTPRGVHLRGLLRVFHNRRLGWVAFGSFLHYLVSDSPIQFRAMSCRHRFPPPRTQDWGHFPPGTKFSRVDESQFWLGQFLQESGKLPCRGPPSGVGGVVASSGQGANQIKCQQLRRMARDWISDIGRDCVPCDAESEEASQTEDLQEWLNWWVSGSVQYTPEDEFLDDEITFNHGYVPNEQPSPLFQDRLGASVMGSKPSTGETASTAREGYTYAGRKASKSDASRTQIHVVGYLSRYWNQPVELRRACHQLMGLDPSFPREKLKILHLCGCGTRKMSAGATSTTTCSEGTHLFLGSDALNRYHEAMHHALRVPYDKFSYNQVRQDLRHRMMEGEMFPGFYGPTPF
ncbi:hypothetical protein JMJ35_010739 [Cladonia borealis]|uniref:Uncharacterized protein n=1 Tax=Cladonia borealis TaxID=184061 RepID=A0AA39QPM2_9LECA|nr:hypothetical protein JMJ35_010749 [Cladonia borealis]KAK0506830.1 hypothetical protein JMJ35_010748 [Cladonia borealis]KAK0506839.1 hypothetical protein JMJ35_010738 [Cladonia borealis]KAK0506840.1 hypothetical protein JMJ35_010739 [Cladonia borealis]